MVRLGHNLCSWVRTMRFGIFDRGEFGAEIGKTKWEKNPAPSSNPEITVENTCTKHSSLTQPRNSAALLKFIDYFSQLVKMRENLILLDASAF